MLSARYGWPKPLITYIGDSNWVLSIIGNYIRDHLESYYSFGMPYFWQSVRGSIIHFGSPPAYMNQHLYRQVHPSNKQILTWTHGQRSNLDPQFTERLDAIGEASLITDKIIVTSRIAEDTLITEGVDRSKLTYIPFGIDTHLFAPPSTEQRSYIRKQLDIPDTAYCIGSFQKDGDGWGEGMSPKWVKGPDVFLSVIQQLSHSYEICVLLTGPARGYVKSGLDEMGVSYRHVWLKDYTDIAKHYWALDLYIIASRDEGGPMAVLESMASGVPLVSTRVGMGVDLIDDGANGFLNQVEDVDGLGTSVSRILDQPKLKQSLSANAVMTAQNYDWRIISKRYDDEVYRPLLVNYELIR